MHKRWLQWCVGLLALGCGADDPPSGEPAIRIAYIESFSGPLADTVLEVESALHLAAHEVNTTGGVGGRRLEIVARDNRADSERARAQTEELVADDVRFVMATSYFSVVAKAAVDGGALALTALGGLGRDEATFERRGRVLRTSGLGDAFTEGWAREIARRGESPIVVAVAANELADPTLPISKLRVLLEAAQCGTGPCEVIIHPLVEGDDGGAGVGATAVAAGAEAILLLSEETDPTLAAIQAASDFTGTWHIHAHHAYAPLASLLAKSEWTRLRWPALAIPPSEAADGFQAGMEALVGYRATRASSAAAYDAILLLAAAIAAEGSDDADAVASRMRAIATAPGETKTRDDLSELLVGGTADVDFEGVSGSLDMNEQGDVTEVFVVTERYDDTGERVVDAE